jgi:hypothetical protein
MSPRKVMPEVEVFRLKSRNNSFVLAHSARHWLGLAVQIGRAGGSCRGLAAEERCERRG